MKKPAMFIRIPKTASSSIIRHKSFVRRRSIKQARKVLWDPECRDPDNPHVLYYDNCYISNVMHHVGKHFWTKGIFSFAFVRNPYDRAVSSWKFGGWGKRWSWNMSFKEFARCVTQLDLAPEGGEYPTSLIQHACLQYPYVHDLKTGESVDYIGRFENLQQDFDIISDTIGLNRRKLPHVNKTKHKHYTEYYDDETIDLITQAYHMDINMFNYKYGD